MCKSGGSLGRIVFPVDSHTAVLLCDVHVCFNCPGFFLENLQVNVFFAMFMCISTAQACAK